MKPLMDEIKKECNLTYYARDFKIYSRIGQFGELVIEIIYLTDKDDIIIAQLTFKYATNGKETVIKFQVSAKYKLTKRIKAMLMQFAIDYQVGKNYTLVTWL